MIHEFIYNGDTKTVELKDNRTATFPESSSKIEIEYNPDGRMFLRQGTNRLEIHAAVNGDKTFVDIGGRLYEFSQPAQDANGGSGGSGVITDPSQVFAPMPGKIVKLSVAVGDKVEPKQHLVIVEAMKMENIIVAKAKGTVKAINFAEGDQVDTDNPIVELELDEK